ncbi:MAG TPA: lipocalin-like domain-containing protein [Candidatus Saccharimonadales bacterium]|jgi:hypothetical protein|nr:lipocalin-like domain-containing protein [Candidatus Saccharimonadales bacterium]
MKRLCVVLSGMLMISGVLGVARYPLAAQIHETPNVQVQFVGTWKLISTEEKLKDGSSRPYQDVGRRGIGYLIYTTDGHMCAEIDLSCVSAARPSATV